MAVLATGVARKSTAPVAASVIVAKPPITPLKPAGAARKRTEEAPAPAPVEKLIVAPGPRVPSEPKVREEVVAAAPGAMTTLPAPAVGVRIPIFSLLPPVNALYSRVPPANCVPRMGSSMNCSPDESLTTSAVVEVGFKTRRPLEICVRPA